MGDSLLFISLIQTGSKGSGYSNSMGVGRDVEDSIGVGRDDSGVGRVVEEDSDGSVEDVMFCVTASVEVVSFVTGVTDGVTCDGVTGVGSSSTLVGVIGGTAKADGDIVTSIAAAWLSVIVRFSL